MSTAYRDDDKEGGQREDEQYRVEERGARERHGELVVNHRLQEQSAPAQLPAGATLF